MGRRGERAAELFVERDALDERHGRPAVLFGEKQPDEVELPKLPPQFRRIANGIVFHLTDHVRGAVARQHVTHRVTQQLLLLVEFKIQH